MKISREFKVGLLATSALVALIWGMNYLKGADMFSSNNRYYAVYNQVDGLVPSSRVVLNGVQIGLVEKIDFLNDRSGRIIVTLSVRRNVFVGKESVAHIVSADFLGARSIDIDLHQDSSPAQNGDTLNGKSLSTFAQQVTPIKDKAEQLIVSLDSLARAIRMVFNDETSYNLNQSLKAIERTSRSIDKLLEPERGKLTQMIANIESITSNIEQNNEVLADIMKNISQVTDSLAAANVTQTINEAGAALAEAAEMMRKINEGEGSLGQMANDDSLYVALTRSAENLDRLLVDFREHPGKYVHVSVFGKKYKEPKK